MAISIDISGNGKLGQDATNPSSQMHYNSLEIYLVSSQTAKNFTVSSGPGIFTQESGTVRHIDWPVPLCIPAGTYNLTFYESSIIDGEPHFIITPITIPIQNPNPSNPPCEGDNELLGQPQPSSPPSQPPFGQGQDQGQGQGQGQGTQTSGMVTSYTGSPPTPTGPVLITVTLSASGGLPFPFPITVTQTASTVIVSEIVRERTVTSLAGTSTLTFVETQTLLVTTTATPPPRDPGGISGAIPVNTGDATRPSFWIILAPLIMIWL
ncbi:hypothetical protein VNI00_001458 [Paramarasmius palmivorus]|uniref:Uncharacterized protein n=1 Tax=Paramarasmius palmivorus TaxID=297713 RepID=A0AAW0E4B5_9AGAR